MNTNFQTIGHPISVFPFASPVSFQEVVIRPYVYSSTPLQPERIDQFLELVLPLRSRDGTADLGSVRVRDFFYFLLVCFQEKGIVPHRMDCIGGSAAWLIGPDLAKKRAEEQLIDAPNLKEFNHLKDIDLAIDLSGYPENILNHIPSLVIEALRRCGIQGSTKELLPRIFFRFHPKIDKDLPIQSLSIGDQKKFWIDQTFSIIDQPRGHLFERDALRIDFLPLFRGAPALFWATDLSDPWAPVDQRLKKILTADTCETINSYGFLMACLYVTRGYTLQNPDALPILRKTFLTPSCRHYQSFQEVLEKVKLNHISSQEEWELFLLQVFLFLLPETQPYEWMFLFSCLEGSQLKSSRFLQASLKNLLDKNSCFSTNDVLCLSRMIFPSLPQNIQAEDWRSFIETSRSLPTEFHSFFKSGKTFPLILAGFILHQEETLLPFSLMEGLMWLEESLNEDEKKEFYSIPYKKIKKGEQVGNSPFLEISLLTNSLPFLAPAQQQDWLAIFLQKLSSIHLSCISLNFLQAIQNPQPWIHKFLLLNNPRLAMNLASRFNKAKIHNLILSYFIAQKRPADFLTYYHQIQKKFPELKEHLLQGTSLDLEDYEKNREQLQQEIVQLDAQNKSESAFEKIKTSSAHFHFNFDFSWVDSFFSRLASRTSFPDILEIFSLWQQHHPQSSLIVEQKNHLLRLFCQKEKMDESFKRWFLKECPSLKLEQSTFLPLHEFVQKNLSSFSPHEVERIFVFLANDVEENLSAQDLLFFSILLSHLFLKQHLLSGKNKKLLESLCSKALKKGLWKELREFLTALNNHQIKIKLEQAPLLCLNQKEDASFSDRLEIWKFMVKNTLLPDDLLCNHVTWGIDFLLSWIQQNRALAIQWLHRQRLWRNDKNKLKILALLPSDFDLRAPLFNSLIQWPESEWEEIWKAAKRDPEKGFKLLTDPRSSFKPSLASELHPCSSLNFYQCFSLLERGFTFTAEMWIQLFKCFSEGESSSYSLILSKLLKEAPFLLEDIFASKEGFDSLEKMVSLLGMQEHDLAISLLTHCHEIRNFIEPQKQLSFFSSLLSCLPAPQDEKTYPIDTQALLLDLANRYVPTSPLAYSLALIRGENEQKKKTIRDIFDLPLLQNNRCLQKLLFSALIHLSETAPPFWEQEGCKLLLKGISSSFCLISLTSIINRLQESRHLGVRTFSLNLILDEGKTENKYKAKCLETFELLVKNKEWNILKNILQTDSIQPWLGEDRLKKVYGDFILEILNWEDSPSLELALNLFRFSNIRSSSYLEQVIKSLSKRCAQFLFKTKDFLHYKVFMDCFSRQLFFTSGNDENKNRLPSQNLVKQEKENQDNSDKIRVDTGTSSLKAQQIYMSTLSFTEASLEEMPNSCPEAFSLEIIQLVHENLVDLIGVQFQRNRFGLRLQNTLSLFARKMLPIHITDSQFNKVLPFYLHLIDISLQTDLFDLNFLPDVERYINGIFFTIHPKKIVNMDLQQQAAKHQENVLKCVSEHRLLFVSNEEGMRKMNIALFTKVHFILGHFIFTYPPSHPQFKANQRRIGSYLRQIRKFHILSGSEWISWYLFYLKEIPLEDIKKWDTEIWEAFEKILLNFKKWDSLQGEDFIYLINILDCMGTSSSQLLINQQTLTYVEQFFEILSPQKMVEMERTPRLLIEERISMIGKILFCHLFAQNLSNEAKDTLAKQFITCTLKWYYKLIESEKEDFLPTVGNLKDFCWDIFLTYPSALLTVYACLSKTLTFTSTIANRKQNIEIRKMILNLIALEPLGETKILKQMRHKILTDHLKSWYEWDKINSSEFYEFLASNTIKAELSSEEWTLLYSLAPDKI